MKTTQNLHIIKLTYSGPKSFNGSKVNLRSESFKVTKSIPYDSSLRDTCEIGERWLSEHGYNIIGHGEGKDCFYVVTDTFVSLKEAKPVKVYNTLDEIFKDATQQITGQQLLNGRAHVWGSWGEIVLSDSLRESVIKTITEKIGGKEETQNKVANALRKGAQHWGIQRMLLDQHGDRPAYITYCAGQDQQWENRQIRKDLTK